MSVRAETSGNADAIDGPGSDGGAVVVVGVTGGSVDVGAATSTAVDSGPVPVSVAHDVKATLAKMSVATPVRTTDEFRPTQSVSSSAGGRLRETGRVQPWRCTDA